MQNRIWVTNLDLLKGRKGQRQTRRIRNGMDKSDAGGPVKSCILCGDYGHTYNKCTKHNRSGEGHNGTASGGRGRGCRGGRGGRHVAGHEAGAVSCSCLPTVLFHVRSALFILSLSICVIHFVVASHVL